MTVGSKLKIATGPEQSLGGYHYLTELLRMILNSHLETIVVPDIKSTFNSKVVVKFSEYRSQGAVVVIVAICSCVN